VVIQLLGFPGTGKYTVGREIVRALEDDGRVAKLLDNHRTANLILDLVPPPGPTGISSEVMAPIIEVRSAVLSTIERLSPREWSFVFTNFLPRTNRPESLDRHRTMAEGRESHFLPVLLECDPDELVRRVVRDERRQRLKLVNPERARAIVEEGMTMPNWPDIRTLDITSLPPPEAARAIIDMIPKGVR